MTNDDVLKMMIKFKPKILNAPDVHFRYNNTNFVLLALIVQKYQGNNFAISYIKIFYTIRYVRYMAVHPYRWDFQTKRIQRLIMDRR